MSMIKQLVSGRRGTRDRWVDAQFLLSATAQDISPIWAQRSNSLQPSSMWEARLEPLCLFSRASIYNATDGVAETAEIYACSSGGWKSRIKV